MLELLRKSVGGVVAKIFIGLLVASFAVWGISDIVASRSGAYVIEVGETKVGLTEFRLAYDQRLNAVSQQVGRRLTREQAQLFGVEAAVISQLTTSALLNENSRAMGLGLSDQRLAQMIGREASFRDASGRFSREELAFALRRVGMSEEQYVREQELAAIRSQIIDAAANGFDVPRAFLDAAQRHRTERRTIAYVEIDASALEAMPEPTEAELESYFATNSERYKAPQYRKLAIVHLTPGSIIDPASVAEADARERYQEQKDNFAQPERRRIQQILFADSTEAQLAHDRLAAGELFDTILHERGLTANAADIGLLASSEVPDINLRNAAFALDLNTPSGIVDGAFGPVILRITEIVASQAPPFAEVEDEIRKALALELAQDAVFDAHDAIEDNRAAGDPLKVAAASQKLDYRIIDAIDRTAQTPTGEIISDIPNSSQLLNEAFETEVGVETNPLNANLSEFVWFEVLKITPERARALDEMLETVRADWIAAEIAAETGKLAHDIKDAVATGGSLELAIAQTVKGVLPTVDQIEGVVRSTSSNVLSPAAIAAAFASTINTPAVAPATKDGSNLLVVATEILSTAPGQGEVGDAEKLQLQQSIVDDLLSQLLSDLQTRETVRINRSALEIALSY